MQKDIEIHLSCDHELAAPFALLDAVQAVATCLLPENIWGQVLSFADYQSMSQCHAAEEFGSVWVSREWYYLLKNSVRVLPLLHAPTPLCGLVWVHSRCAFWASTSTIEGLLFPCYPVFDVMFEYSLGIFIHTGLHPLSALTSAYISECGICFLLL